VDTSPSGANSMQVQSAEEKQSLRLLVVLSVLLAFASISTDLYLPALPTMSVALGASDGTLQLTISGYLLGFGFGQLFWGPISDRYGRRGPIAFGILVFAAGSAGCALSTDAGQLIGWRVVQAIGASAGVALARAMVRDLYERDKAARLLSTLMTVMAIAPLLGPSVGAQILAFASWRAIFWTLVAIGLATIVGVFTLPETLAPEKRASGSLRPVLAGYAALFGNRQFLGYAAAVGCFYAGIFANIAGAPFAYISYHHLSPQLYALLFAAGIAGLMIANVLNSRLVTRYGSDRLLFLGTAGAALFGIIVALVTATDWGGIYGLVPALFLFGSMNGFILANAVAGALSSVPARTGAASALLGAIQYGSGMVGSAMVGIFANGTPLPMGCVIALAGLGSLLCVLLAGKHRRT
jgi:DHA1 family bicyclomycin/chloramphenicol resistance-like MFS transporter